MKTGVKGNLHFPNLMTNISSYPTEYQELKVVVVIFSETGYFLFLGWFADN